MTEKAAPPQVDPSHEIAQPLPVQPPGLHVVLSAHRSLGPTGFMVLMTLFGGVSFITGVMFLTVGAWPVLAFFGLDVALVYLAFKLNYRAGKIHELVDLTPQSLTITRIHPSGARENFDFNPYWARVALEEWPDGRTDLRIASHGHEFPFARFLNDDERREFAEILRDALIANRTAPHGAV